MVCLSATPVFFFKIAQRVVNGDDNGQNGSSQLNLYPRGEGAATGFQAQYEKHTEYHNGPVRATAEGSHCL